MRKVLLTWIFLNKFHGVAGCKGYVFGECGNYACACVAPITVWVVSKNESNCLLGIRWNLYQSGEVSDYCSCSVEHFTYHIDLALWRENYIRKVFFVTLSCWQRILNLSILSKNSSWGFEGLCDRWVRELGICASHMNDSVGCIKERIKLPGRKWGGICITLETCQISVCCSVKHFMAYCVAILPLPM